MLRSFVSFYVFAASLKHIRRARHFLMRQVEQTIRQSVCFWTATSQVSLQINH